jgi:hypothetical protein
MALAIVFKAFHTNNIVDRTTTQKLKLGLNEKGEMTLQLSGSHGLVYNLFN